MTETEIKLRVESPGAAVERIMAAGLSLETPRHFEVNLVLDTPEGSLRSAGRLLRVRSAANRTVLTFKGRSENGVHKSREEIETVCDDFDATVALFERLGYRPVFRYEKFRSEFAREGDAGHVTLDETPIGTFLELEGEPHWIDEMAARLGFAGSDYVTASYGSLYAAHCAARSLTPSNMIFGGTLLK